LAIPVDIDGNMVAVQHLVALRRASGGSGSDIALAATGVPAATGATVELPRDGGIVVFDLATGPDNTVSVGPCDVFHATTVRVPPPTCPPVRPRLMRYAGAE